MVKLRRITEATDSSHTSIMYNLADNLKRKGWDCTYDDKRGIRVNFSFNPDFDLLSTKEAKDWLNNKNNKGKSLVFKGDGLSGSFIWDIIKNDAGKRELVTKDVTVKGTKDLLALQKKLKANKPENGKLTGRSAELFKNPEPYIITNLATPTFQSFLRRLRDQIINKVALSLSEVIEKPVGEEKKESYRYFIEYDENYNRVNEGFIKESDNKPISWKDDNVQKAIIDAVKGLEVDKSKTTDKELIFKFNGKNGSLHLKGYMLVLDTDTDDDVPPTNYPVKDKNNLTIEDLLDTIKTVFSRRESALNKGDVVKEKRLDEEVTESVENHIKIHDVDDPDIHTSPVFQDVAKERFRKLVGDSLLVAPRYEKECLFNDPEFNKDIFWVYLSPSYALSQLSNIVIPICLDERMVSLPIADMPDPNYVFDGDSEDMNVGNYDEAVQDYLLNDAPMSDIIQLDLDNADEAKGSVVSIINGMAEDYLDKKAQIEDSLEITGESLLKESRYFIVPADTDLSGDVKKLNFMGYTDLDAAKQAMQELNRSGQYDFDLGILDTNFSKNKDKWLIL